MTDLGIYCCGDTMACRSYVDDGVVGFKYISSETGMLKEKYDAEGIGWIFLLFGILEVQCEGRCISVEAGEMCLLPANAYVIKCITDCKLIFFTSDRPTEYCCRMLQDLPEYKPETQCEVTKLRIISPLDKYLELTQACLQSGINCRYWFEEKQQELFMLLNIYYSGEELSVFLHSLTSHRERDLKKFIIENSIRARSVQELADICGYSMSGFKRLFKEMFDESVYKWMLQQKAERLKLKLGEKNVSLKVIIDEFGFSSPAHFTKFCKQWLGMVPTQFVKTQQGKLNF